MRLKRVTFSSRENSVSGSEERPILFRWDTADSPCLNKSYCAVRWGYESLHHLCHPHYYIPFLSMLLQICRSHCCYVILKTCNCIRQFICSKKRKKVRKVYCVFCSVLMSVHGVLSEFRSLLTCTVMITKQVITQQTDLNAWSAPGTPSTQHALLTAVVCHLVCWCTLIQ